MFLKTFEIRWNDLDANRHLANVTYLGYASETRMALLNSLGLTHKSLMKMGLGPIIFNESLTYFKEVLPDDEIRVSCELAGLSQHGTFFSFRHNYYNQKGKNVARCQMMGGWIDLATRKLAALPQDLWQHFDALPKTVDFRNLTPADTRIEGIKPQDLES